MGAAWRGPSQVGAGQWARVLAMVAQIRAMDMEVCTTLGMLTPEQARPPARLPPPPCPASETWRSGTTLGVLTAQHARLPHAGAAVSWEGRSRSGDCNSRPQPWRP
jgi:hypothetical protein